MPEPVRNGAVQNRWSVCGQVEMDESDWCGSDRLTVEAAVVGVVMVGAGGWVARMHGKARQQRKTNGRMPIFARR